MPPTNPGPGGRFPAIFYLSPQPVSLSEFESGRYLEVNEAWLELLGYRHEEVIGKSRSELNIWVSSEERQRIRGLLEQNQSVRDVPLQCRRKSGELLDILFSCDSVEYGGVRCMLAALSDITPLKRAEALLRQSQHRFASMLDAVPQSMYIVRIPDGRFIEANRACATLYGYSRNEIIGHSASDLQLWANPEDRALLVDGLAPGESRAIETRLRRKSGEILDVHCTATLTELDGEPVFIGTSLDITERKQAERLLRQSEERFSAIFEASPLAMTVVRRSDGVYLQVNRAYERLLGFRRDEVVGRTARDLGVWADPESRARLVRRLDRDGSSASVEAPVRRKDGTLFDAIFSATLATLDGVEVIHGTVLDISDLRRITRLKTQADERFERIVETSPLAMTFTRLEDGVYLDVNAASEALLGYAREEMVGHSSTELGIWVDPGVRGAIRAQLAHGNRVASLEAQVRTKDGRVLEIFFSATVIEVDGVPVLHGTAFDLTRIKQATRDQHASEERFSKMFRASPDAIVITRLADGAYVEMNDAWHEQFGYRREDLIGRRSVDVGVWVDVGERERLVAEVRRFGAARSFETRLRRRSGEIADVVLSAEVIELDGAESLIICIVDVTERKRAERLRDLSELRFAKVFQVSPDALIISRQDGGGYIEVNDAWTAMFGHSRADIAGRTSEEIGIWIDRAARKGMVERIARGEPVRQFESRMRHRSGKVIDVVLSADAIQIEGQDCLVASITDITELRRNERARLLSDERFAKVFRASPSPILIVRQDTGTYSDANQAWLRLYGFAREDVIGRTSDELGIWIDPVERERLLAQMKEQGVVRGVEVRHRTRSGEVIEVMNAIEQISLDGEASWVICVEDVTERRRAERHIEYLATRDHLTGLPNRLLFADRLRQAMAKAARGGHRVALMFIDLDRFKDINDSLGHHVGDRLLTEVAARLTAVVRGGDTVARQGGDEFLVMIDGLAQGRDAGPVAQKLVDALSEPFRIDDKLMTVSCSVGISVYPDDAQNEEDLMRNSDLAMYDVKDAGRNDYRFFSADMNQRLVERMALETRLREALGRGEFALHYQPKVDMRDGHVTGCEALLRWHHPEQGLILPGRFIGIAEDTRLILPIGEWVLRQACTEVRRWMERGFRPVPVAINLSVHQFDAGLPDVVAAALTDTGLAPELLEIEITETVMMRNTVAHLDIMRRLKGLGVRLTLDDFGTGYSSLSYLKQMEIDTLKIDQSFVRELAVNSEDRSIVAAIIAMAGEFGMKTVAEGVESQAQAEALKSLNCSEYQGFLISQAIPAVEFEQRYLLAA